MSTYLHVCNLLHSLVQQSGPMVHRPQRTGPRTKSQTGPRSAPFPSLGRADRTKAGPQPRIRASLARTAGLTPARLSRMRHAVCGADSPSFSTRSTRTRARPGTAQAIDIAPQARPSRGKPLLTPQRYMQTSECGVPCARGATLQTFRRRPSSRAFLVAIFAAAAGADRWRSIAALGPCSCP